MFGLFVEVNLLYFIYRSIILAFLSIPLILIGDIMIQHELTRPAIKNMKRENRELLDKCCRTVQLL